MKSKQFPGVDLYESETLAEWLWFLRDIIGAILLGVAICAAIVLIASWL